VALAIPITRTLTARGIHLSQYSLNRIPLLANSGGNRV
jgi:hypothetical protein